MRTRRYAYYKYRSDDWVDTQGLNATLAMNKGIRVEKNKESPLQVERRELGYRQEVVRKGRALRVIHKPCKESDVCVFFVHGAGGRAGQFKHLIKKLENKVNVVAFDFLGHGESAHINNSNLYTADEHLEDLIAIYKKYKMNINIYVSHSYGNIHVLRHLKLLKLRNKLDTIGGVIMMGFGVGAPVSLGLARRLPCFVLEWLRPLARSASNEVMFTPHTNPNLIDFENYMTTTNRMYTMKTIGLDCCNQATWDRWLQDGKETLVGSNVPCALISGEEDNVFNLERSKKLKDMFEVPDSNYHVIKGVGHLPMLERGDEVAEIVKNFLFYHSSKMLKVIERSMSR